MLHPLSFRISVAAGESARIAISRSVGLAKVVERELWKCSESTTSLENLPVNANAKWYHFRWRLLLIVPAVFLILGGVSVPRQLAQRQARAELTKVGATLRTQQMAFPGATDFLARTRRSRSPRSISETRN